MIIDKLKKPMSLWVEDEHGNVIQDEESIMNDGFCEKAPKRFSNSRLAEVVHTIYGESTPDNPSGKIAAFSSTFGCGGVAIAKMVLEHNWKIDDACVLWTVLCEGCMNTVGSELEGYAYDEQPNTCCEYCDIVRPGVQRPMTQQEEKQMLHDTLTAARLPVYASLSGIIVSMMQPRRRVVTKDEVTGIYRITES
jgi:hypothetical protein